MKNIEIWNLKFIAEVMKKQEIWNENEFKRNENLFIWNLIFELMYLFESWKWIEMFEWNCWKKFEICDEMITMKNAVNLKFEIDEIWFIEMM